MLWHNQSTGDLYAWYMNSVTRTSTAYPSPSRVIDTSWQVAGMGDLTWTAGTTSVAEPGDRWPLRVVPLGVGRAHPDGLRIPSPSAAATDWRVRGIADFNGDGKQDLLWHRQTDGALYVWS